MATHSEALLISAMIRTRDATTHAHAGVTVSHFHVYEAEWRWVERYIARFRKTPSKEAFRLKFPDFPLKAVDDVEHFCDEVRREHARFLFSEVVEQALDFVEYGDIEAGASVLRSGLTSIESSLQGDSGAFSLLADDSSIYADVKHRVDTAASTGQAGVPLGFPTLDSATGGAQPGDYIIVGARLGIGKTWTLIQMATAAMIAGHQVMFVTLEQTRNQIAFRIHNLLSATLAKRVFSSSELMTGKGFSLAEYKKFLDDLKTRAGLGDIHILDGSRGKVSAATLGANIERVKPDIVFVDYLTLLDTRDKDWQSVAKLSNDVQHLAMRYQVPIVAAAQINRGGEGMEPPMVSQLGLSDAIGQDADVVVTLGKQSEHILKFRLAKFRNGSSAIMWHCQFDPSSGNFKEVSYNKAREIIERDSEVD